MSKRLSYILRHKPESIGIKLDRFGYANVEELLDKLKMDKEELEKIVATDNKNRYSFNEDKTKIRANQGHSIKVDLELKEIKPPKVLYHGTVEKFLDSIKEKGLLPQQRQYVHLSEDLDTAISVGKRRGEPIILEIDSYKMYEEGGKFYKSENGVWLTDKVDKRYIKTKGDKS